MTMPDLWSLVPFTVLVPVLILSTKKGGAFDSTLFFCTVIRSPELDALNDFQFFDHNTVPGFDVVTAAFDKAGEHDDGCDCQACGEDFFDCHGVGPFR
jgi:hypothetical protein